MYVYKRRNLGILKRSVSAVGDIPDPARARGRSRDDVSSVNSSSLQLRSTSRSFSLFAPWTPRAPPAPHARDLHYAQRARPAKPREPFKKASSTRNLSEDRPATLLRNKSSSQSTLTKRPSGERLAGSAATLHRKPDRRDATLSRAGDGKRSQSSELLASDARDRVSRSVSMPRDDNKKAGWFKLSNKKKQETTRVR